MNLDGKEDFIAKNTCNLHVLQFLEGDEFGCVLASQVFQNIYERRLSHMIQNKLENFHSCCKIGQNWWMHSLGGKETLGNTRAAMNEAKVSLSLLNSQIYIIRTISQQLKLSGQCWATFPNNLSFITLPIDFVTLDKFNAMELNHHGGYSDIQRKRQHQLKGFHARHGCKFKNSQIHVLLHFQDMRSDFLQSTRGE